MEEIIEKNLKKMRGVERGEMQYLLMRESFGGNAGFWKNCSCACTNFFYDKKNGEIIYFGNIQDVPKDIVKNYNEHRFRIALDNKIWKIRIADYKAPKKASRKARENLEETVRRYNKEFGFGEED